MEGTHSSKVQHSPTTPKYENVHIGNIYTADIHVHRSASSGMPVQLTKHSYNSLKYSCISFSFGSWDVAIGIMTRPWTERCTIQILAQARDFFPFSKRSILVLRPTQPFI